VVNEGDTQELPQHQTQQLPRTVAVRQTRRILIAILGGLLVAVGLLFIPVPVVPGWILVIAGLTVLSWEFYWARRLLDQSKAKLRSLTRKRR
jgi:uncharacterized protein (TIGR02611 family)